MEYDEFLAFYEKYGKCPNDMQFRSKRMNEKQLKRRYTQYCASEEKREERDANTNPLQSKYEPDEKWIEVREAVFLRDSNYCQLWRVLSIEEKKLFNMTIDPTVVDPAHVFGKGAFPHLKYDMDNVYSLHRAFHGRLDTQKHPLTGQAITKEEKQVWWERIVSPSEYERLRKMAFKIEDKFLS